MSEKNQVSTVLIDDDADSRKLLNILLKKFPQIKVVGEASSVTNALSIIKEKKPDSVFLDICLGKNSGFDVVNKISPGSKVVFVSAFDDYALRAFEVNALDYLKKPIDRERLAITVSRLLSEDKEEKVAGESKEEIIPAKDQQNESDKKIISKEKFKSLYEDYDGGKNDLEDDEPDIDDKPDPGKKSLDYDDRLFLTIDGVSRFIKISSIECITAEKDYSYVHIAGAKKILVLKPMIEWEERLPSKCFARIHRSTIINLEYVEKVEKWFNSSYHVFIHNISEPFQMSRRYASKLKERFK